MKARRGEGESWADEPPPSELLRAIGEFNRGAFYECHETLEALWRDEPRPLRRFYQGVLQIGVAFHHQRRGNHRGATLLLDRGIRHLGGFAPRCLGVDVDRLLAAARRAQGALRALGPARCGELDAAFIPRIELVDPTAGSTAAPRRPPIDGDAGLSG